MKKAPYDTSLNADLAKYREGVCKSKCNFAWLNARCAFSFVNISINKPRVGFNSKTTQSKCVLEARRMYNFADYVLRMLKHLPILLHRNHSPVIDLDD